MQTRLGACRVRPGKGLLFFKACFLAGTYMIVERPEQPRHAKWRSPVPADANAPAYVEHQIFVQASCEAIWNLLTDIERWPDWNPGVSKARWTSTGLALDSEFRWSSAGLGIRSTLTRVDAPHHLEWHGIAIGTRAIHAWSLEPEANGTRVFTSESFDGWLVRLMPGAMQKTLDRALPAWLDALKMSSERL